MALFPGGLMRLGDDGLVAVFVGLPQGVKERERQTAPPPGRSQDPETGSLECLVW